MQLYQNVGYVVALLQTDQSYEIKFPSDDERGASVQKSAHAFTDNESQQAVKHYRAIISDDRIGAEQKKLAKLELLAVACVALHRAHPEHPVVRDTQLLSIVNMIMQGGNVFSEINTGQGKSITIALMAVMQWAEGGAVDILTSDMSLAQRDHAEFKDFYRYLGIKTQVIQGERNQAVQYDPDGMHYSTMQDISLWHEQQLVARRPLPQKVSALCDEVDFALLDNTTECRYAKSLDDTPSDINPDEMYYWPIFQFVSQRAHEQVFTHTAKRTTIGEDIVALKAYIQASDLTNAEKKHFQNFTSERLARWMESAFIAAQLHEDRGVLTDPRQREDYTIRQNLVKREGEERDVSEAKVKIFHEVAPASRFSHGVHQFLHVILNERMKRDPDFRKRCRDLPFLIEQEKLYLAGLSAKNTADFYKARGHLIGLSGTVATFTERHTLRQYFDARIYKIPPHHVSQFKAFTPRVAKPKWISSETPENAHYRVILEQIHEAKKRGQAILILCDSVRVSEKLYVYLSVHLDKKTLQLYADELGRSYKKTVENAGVRGMVTISPLLGRGTDIQVQPTAGLHVITTYIPPERVARQGCGRAARGADCGSAQMILCADEFSTRQMTTPKSTEQLQTAITEVQRTLEANQASDRYKQLLFADLRNEFQQRYFASRLEQNEPKDHERWAAFLRWLETAWTTLLDEVEKLAQTKQRELTAPDVFDTWRKERWEEKITALRGTAIAQYQERIGRFVPPVATMESRITVAPDVSIATDTLAVPTERHKHQPLLSYVALSGRATDEHKSQVLLHCLKEINAYVTKIPEQKNPRLINIASRLLAEFYILDRKNAPSFKQCRVIRDLVHVVSGYGTDSDKNDLYKVFNAINDEMILDTHNPRRGHSLLTVQVLVCPLKISMRRSENAAMDASSRDLRDSVVAVRTGLRSDMHHQQCWKNTLDFAIARLSPYVTDTLSFWRASDRTKQARELLKFFSTPLSMESCESDSQKIQVLLNRLYQDMQNMVETDLKEDGKSRVFQRNRTGSRLHNILNDITAFALSQQAEIHRTSVSTTGAASARASAELAANVVAAVPDQRIAMLKVMLDTINTRTQKLGLTYQIPVDNIDRHTWPAVIARLRALKTRVNQLWTGKQGLLTLIDNTLVQINLLQKSTVATMTELLTDHSILVMEATLQARLEQLVLHVSGRDRLTMHGIDVTKRYDCLRDIPKHQQILFQKLLGEIENTLKSSAQFTVKLDASGTTVTASFIQQDRTEKSLQFSIKNFKMGSQYVSVSISAPSEEASPRYNAR